ncbi:MAG: SusC/RagA family TonB-linked outer membrane protein [Bacteroidales bacterium]
MIRNKYIESILFALMLTINAYAQNTKVTGAVYDRTGPLPGATIIIQGQEGGTLTDAEGKFSIHANNPHTAVLVVRFIGLDEIRVPLEGKVAGISVQMKESVNELNDVVVVGYGTQKRGNITGAIASVKGEELAKIPATSVAEAMIGKLPGVQITTTDGSPGADVMIRVRGGGSITEDNSPLILVDGFEVSNLNEIPPTDIASIEVLKDAASTAIYGARGANGVVLVTTTQPKAGNISVSVHGYMQMKQLSNKLEVMDSYEFVMMQYEEARRGSSALSPADFADKYGNANELYIYQEDAGTDWQDELFGTSPIAKYLDVSVNGGTEKTKYKLTLLTQDQPGVLIGSGLSQTNFNLAINAKLTERVSLEFRSRMTNRSIDGSGTGGVSLLDALREAPTRGLTEHMTLPEDDTYFDPDAYEEITRFNPQEEAAKNYRKRISRSFNTQGSLSWKVLDNLVYRGEFGLEYRYAEDGRFWGVGTSTANGNDNMPVASWGMSQSPRWQMTNTLNYNFEIKELHQIQLMMGQEMKNHRSFGKTYRSRYFPVNITGEKALDNLAMGTPYENSSSGGSPNRIASFFGRANYGYADKYLATFTFRTDGSTKFGPNNRWGTFPALAVAWRISNETFMHNFEALSNLKLRLSYGASGNDRISGDLYSKYYGVYRSNTVGWGETDHSYYDFYNIAYLMNPNVKWETTITRNLGVDFGFFKEKLTGSIDIYQNTVKDLLVPSDIPSASGFSKIMTNVGQTTNRGMELALNAYVVDKKDFSVNLNFNIGFNKNRIDKLASGEKEWTSSSSWAGSDLIGQDDYRAYAGGTKGLIYGYVNDGFYTTEDFSNFDGQWAWTLKEDRANAVNMLRGNPTPGDPKFKKLTNDGTQVVDSDDRQVIGETTPDFSGGFGINASWRNFDLSAFLNFMCGFDVYNANKIMMTSWSRNRDNNLGMEVSLKKRWRRYDDMGNDLRRDPERLAEFNKNASFWNPHNLTKPVSMSYAIEDGSFLRLQNLQVGYTLPRTWTKKVRLSKVRFYATGSNLFTWTNYSGYDPEVNIETGLTPNVDHNAYPRTRNYTFGAQVSF